MITTTLIKEIEAALGAAIKPELTNVSAASDVFEAYILTLVLQAAASEGATITYRGPDDNPTRRFVFRTSPGYIWSAAHPYTFALIQFPGVVPLEAQIGIRVSGKSRVLHELDVCVLRRAEAVIARAGQVHPRYGAVVLGIECKFYSTPLSLGLARAFVGLGTDLKASTTFFVTNAKSPSVAKLLSAHRRKWGHRAMPGAIVDIERLRNEFQSIFMHFKAL